MTTLKIKSKGHHGQLHTLPLIGEVQLSKEGTFETDNEELIKMLTTKTIDWEIVGGEAETEEGEENETDASDKATLEELSLADLVAMAEEMKYPKAEYSKYKKNQKLMVNYLNKKSKEE